MLGEYQKRRNRLLANEPTVPERMQWGKIRLKLEDIYRKEVGEQLRHDYPYLKIWTGVILGEITYGQAVTCILECHPVFNRTRPDKRQVDQLDTLKQKIEKHNGEYYRTINN